MVINERKKHRKNKKTPSAQEQVGGKVNQAYAISAAYGCGDCGGIGMMEESDYNIGFEPNDIDGYAHVNEEATNKSMDFDYKKYIKSLLEFMGNNGIQVKPYPRVVLHNKEQDGFFVNTGNYEPETKTVNLFIFDRHPKDIMRSFAHEMIHHNQNLRGVNLSFTTNDDVKDNEKLEEIESEAYLKGNIVFRKWTEHERKKGVLNESVETEIVEPENVDLSSFNLKKNLNKKFWKDGKLDTRVRLKLLDIADDFMKEAGLDESDVEDIIFTGSLANYNWNEKYSDIDLHIVIDYDDFDVDKELLSDYYYAKKDAWNQKHNNITIHGFPVEVYVQDVNEKATTSGYYSLEKDKWIDKPDVSNFTDKKINKEYIKEKVSQYTDKIDKLCVFFNKFKNDDAKLRKIYKKEDKLWDKIRAERTNGFEKSNSEINNGNLIFKSLRRMDYIGKLADLKQKTYDKLNSLD